MDFREIRRTVITAMFSDDELLERLVLKGGNALELVHGVIARGSLDVDLAMEAEFEDLEDARKRIFAALRGRFEGVGYVVFDMKFGRRPRRPGEKTDPRWGGYDVKFQLIERNKYESLGGNLEHIRRQAQTIGPGQERVFGIDISKYEYCGNKIEAELDGFAIYVYSQEMCVIEKLRALCQQMPEYELVGERLSRPRARDFFDIHAVLSTQEIDLASEGNVQLLRAIFDAKKVPLELLGRIEEYREFHRQDWDQVVLASGAVNQNFDFYFDFVIGEIAKLKAFWIE